MARNEARIFTSIWKDPDFLTLPPTAQRLYMFLLSQDDLTYCGVMPLRERRWAAKAAGLSAADVEQDLKALEASDRRFVIADRDTGELFVRSLMRRDGVWKQPNLLKLARESADQVESQRIREGLLVELRRLPLHETGSELVRRVVDDFIQDLEQGTPYPSAYPTPYPSDYPNRDPSVNPTADPSANPSENPYARARGTGEGYGGKKVSPGPRYPGTPN